MTASARRRKNPDVGGLSCSVSLEMRGVADVAKLLARALASPTTHQSNPDRTLDGQRHFEVAVASSRSAFATHLRLEAAATMCLREPQNPALSLEEWRSPATALVQMMEERPKNDSGIHGESHARRAMFHRSERPQTGNSAISLPSNWSDWSPNAGPPASIGLRRLVA